MWLMYMYYSNFQHIYCRCEGLKCNVALVLTGDQKRVLENLDLG
jgi:hypothetical protein